MLLCACVWYTPRQSFGLKGCAVVCESIACVTTYLSTLLRLIIYPFSQLYRVNIFLQPPDAVEPPTSKPPYFVLRRYSQFNNLYKEVRLSPPRFLAVACMHAPRTPP